MPNFIALYVFNDIETCRPYNLMIQLEIAKFLKKFIWSGFQIIIKFTKFTKFTDFLTLVLFD